MECFRSRIFVAPLPPANGNPCVRPSYSISQSCSTQPQRTYPKGASARRLPCPRTLWTKSARSRPSRSQPLLGPGTPRRAPPFEARSNEPQESEQLTAPSSSSMATLWLLHGRAAQPVAAANACAPEVRVFTVRRMAVSRCGWREACTGARVLNGGGSVQPYRSGIFPKPRRRHPPIDQELRRP